MSRVGIPAAFQVPSSAPLVPIPDGRTDSCCRLARWLWRCTRVAGALLVRWDRWTIGQATGTTRFVCLTAFGMLAGPLVQSPLRWFSHRFAGSGTGARGTILFVCLHHRWTIGHLFATLRWCKGNTSFRMLAGSGTASLVSASYACTTAEPAVLQGEQIFSYACQHLSSAALRFAAFLRFACVSLLLLSVRVSSPPLAVPSFYSASLYSFARSPLLPSPWLPLRCAGSRCGGLSWFRNP